MAGNNDGSARLAESAAFRIGCQFGFDFYYGHILKTKSGNELALFFLFECISINSIGGYMGPDNLDLDRYYSLEELGDMNPGKLKPMSIKIGDQIFSTNSWSSLCVDLVGFLYRSGVLKDKHIPMFTYNEKDKYFINKEPIHRIRHKDSSFKQVPNTNLYVDVKYRADYHVKNLLYMFDKLKLKAGAIELKFRPT